MSNIQIKNQVIKNLSPTAKEVYFASQKDMIKNIEDKNNVSKAIKVAVNRAIADKGVNMHKDDINYLITNIIHDIIKDFSILSLEDVYLCFSMGVRGKLGEYYGLNVSTLYGWLQKYQNEVLPMANAEIVALLPKPVEIENIDKEKIELESVDEICSLIENNEIDFFNDFGNFRYNLLERYDFIHFSSEQKKEFFNQAREQYILELQKNNRELIEQGRSIQISPVSDFITKLENNNKTTNDIVVMYAKKIAFRYFISNINDKQKLRVELTKKIKDYYGTN
jgi:penicillin-binding protein-related factor A (putative recombinase)